jgi:tyrosyl-DNA phosphodiesterase 2
VRIVSWNLNGLDDTDLDVRVEAALFRMLLGGPPEEVLLRGTPPPPPDVLLMQEVVARSYHAHLRPQLLAAGYTLVPATVPDRDYFEVVAVHRSHAVAAHTTVPLDRTLYGRWLTGVTLASGVRVYTAHLDSLAEGSAARRAQLAQLRELLGEGPAVFAGDTNLRDAEVGDLGAMRDAWEAAGSDPAHRWTWLGRRARCRFDRAYVAGLEVRAFRAFGAEVLPATGAPASDHLGIELVVA